MRRRRSGRVAGAIANGRCLVGGISFELILAEALWHIFGF